MWLSAMQAYGGFCADEEQGSRIPILYGGSVNPQNAQELIALPDVDGLFIGRSAWDASQFNRIIRQVMPLYMNK